VPRAVGMLLLQVPCQARPATGFASAVTALLRRLRMGPRRVRIPAAGHRRIPHRQRERSLRVGCYERARAGGGRRGASPAAPLRDRPAAQRRSRTGGREGAPRVPDAGRPGTGTRRHSCPDPGCRSAAYTPCVVDLLDGLPALSLTELRYLVAVDELRHFGRAAAACHVTQPTLSSGIKKLEGTLGVVLFERSRRAVRPTPVGVELARQARRVLEETHELVRVARREARPLVGPLRLGVIPTLGPYLLPWLLPLLTRAFPELQPRPHEAFTAELLEALRGQRLDAAFLALPIEEAGLVALPVFEEPFWLLTPADHPLAKRERIRERDLSGCRVLLLTEGHCLRDQALELCARAEADAAAQTYDVRATSLETLRQLVGAGMGCTLLPALAVPGQREAGTSTRLRPFAHPAPSRRIALVYRKTYPRPQELEALAQALREELPEGVRALEP
jgi:LysR family transcriptional regulator, hydrogen peroxide-inducible genes activator